MQLASLSPASRSPVNLFSLYKWFWKVVPQYKSSPWQPQLNWSWDWTRPTPKMALTLALLPPTVSDFNCAQLRLPFFPEFFWALISPNCPDIHYSPFKTLWHLRFCDISDFVTFLTMWHMMCCDICHFVTLHILWIFHFQDVSDLVTLQHFIFVTLHILWFFHFQDGSDFVKLQNFIFVTFHILWYCIFC